jgi:hypothetical protein
MTVSRQNLVEQAIKFGWPERVPIVFWNRDQEAGDIMLCHLALGAPGDGTPNAWNWSENEWDYRLESLGDGTLGHPIAPFDPELPQPETVRVPGLRELERMSAVPAFLKPAATATV